MKAADAERSDDTRSFSFWFAVLSPVLGIAAGVLAPLLFHLR